MRANRTIEAELLTSRQVAAMLAISSATLWRMTSDGRLPRPIHIGPYTLRWRRATIMHWLDSLERSNGHSHALAVPRATRKPRAVG
jgi:predicted DNA-binding transcriptional regulator AlpA